MMYSIGKKSIIHKTINTNAMKWNSKQDESYRRDCLQQFWFKINQGPFPISEEMEMINKGDVERFEAYVKRYKLSFKAERKLLESRRKELYELYFNYQECDENNETYLVQIPEICKAYLKHRIPKKKAQLIIAKERSEEERRRFLGKAQFCAEAEGPFMMKSAEKTRDLYSEKYSLHNATREFLKNMGLDGILDRADRVYWEWAVVSV